MLEIIPNTCFTFEAFVVFSLQSLIYTDIPSHLATALESRMVLPKVEIFGVTVSWRVICLPTEFIHNVIPQVIVVLSVTIITYGLAINTTIVSFLQYEQININCIEICVQFPSKI